MKKKWIFEDTFYSIITEDDKETILYTDELECKETLKDIVKLYNEGKTLQEIDSFLMDDERCTQDEREIIIEGIYPFLIEF